MYGNLVAGFGIGCIKGGRYHGGINIHRLGVGHSNDITCGLKGGPPSISPMGELPPCESLGFLPLVVGE